LSIKFVGGWPHPGFEDDDANDGDECHSEEDGEDAEEEGEVGPVVGAVLVGFWT
jgi:hypothetical protein